MALLHSFEFGPAIDAFNTVLGVDSNCAIAYWGIALSHWSNPQVAEILDTFDLPALAPKALNAAADQEDRTGIRR